MLYTVIGSTSKYGKSLHPCNLNWYNYQRTGQVCATFHASNMQAVKLFELARYLSSSSATHHHNDCPSNSSFIASRFSSSSRVSPENETFRNIVPVASLRRQPTATPILGNKPKNRHPKGDVTGILGQAPTAEIKIWLDRGGQARALEMQEEPAGYCMIAVVG